MRVIVSVTGPLLHLREAGAESLLERAGKVSIPATVDQELGMLDPDWPEERPGWLRLSHLSGSARAEAMRWQQSGLLDPGEADAIALAKGVDADWFLTDDLAARFFAQAIGIEVHGSLGIILWAAAVGLLDQEHAETVLKRLTNSSLWVSDRIARKAEAALREFFAP